MSKKQPRENRSLSVESLENRQLMASDITAWVSNGTLNIRGSDSNDRVQVWINPGFTRIQNLATGRSANFQNSTFSSINVNMGAGRDAFTLQGQNMKALDAVFIDMGSGSSEALFINQTTARNLTIDARAAVGTGATLAGVNVTGTARVDFGNDAGNDSLGVQSGSSLNNLWLNTGGGNDRVTLRRTVVNRATVNLGDGNDGITLLDNSAINAGVVDGGAGVDFATPRGLKIGGRLVNFES